MAVTPISVIVLCVMVSASLVVGQNCASDYPKDCQDVYDNGNHCSGKYTIHVGPYLQPVDVYCAMDAAAGKGCVVFQRRLDGSEDFYRSWNTYRSGFGNLHREFWLGNDNLHLITNQNSYQLRITMGRFNGQSGQVKYSVFRVDSEYEKYGLTVGGFSGPGSPWDDNFAAVNGMKFTTYDQDNDITGSMNCAVHYKTAWWMGACFHATLNGPYQHQASTSYAIGLTWSKAFGFYESLQYTEMRLCR